MATRNIHKENLWRLGTATYAAVVGKRHWSPYPWCTDLLRRVQYELTKKDARIIINAPPRHGKTESVSHWLPTWYIDTWPHRRVILTSNTADLAVELSGRIRDELETNPLCLSVPRKDSRSREMWRTMQSGGVKAAGAGGTIIGRGADLFIIDDPHKDIHEALSPTARKKIIEWFNGTAYHRLEPNGSIVVIQTRWHEGDLSGYLINEHDDDWTVFRYPALAEDDDDILGRSIGEPLCPERFSAEAIESKKAMGSYLFAGLYQQRPAPLEGGMVKAQWFRYWSSLPDNLDEWIQSWDLTFKETGTSYVVGQVWARKSADYYLVDQIRGKMGFNDQVKAMISMSQKWPRAVTKIIEDAADAQAVKATLERDISGIILTPAKGSKEANLAAVVGVIESGNVFLPNAAEWLGDFLAEVTTFPAANNDDQVDAMSHGLQRFQKVSYTTDFQLPLGDTRASPWEF